MKTFRLPQNSPLILGWDGMLPLLGPELRALVQTGNVQCWAIKDMSKQGFFYYKVAVVGFHNDDDAAIFKLTYDTLPASTR